MEESARIQSMFNSARIAGEVFVKGSVPHNVKAIVNVITGDNTNRK